MARARSIRLLSARSNVVADDVRPVPRPISRDSARPSACRQALTFEMGPRPTVAKAPSLAKRSPNLLAQEEGGPRAPWAIPGPASVAAAAGGAHRCAPWWEGRARCRVLDHQASRNVLPEGGRHFIDWPGSRAAVLRHAPPRLRTARSALRSRARSEAPRPTPPRRKSTPVPACRCTRRWRASRH